MAVQDFAAGSFRYIPGVFQYSAGVAALPGFEIIRVRFMTPVPLAEGFARIGQYILDARAPAHRLLRLRTALARTLHR